jgi:hypothetical protein
MNLPDHIIKDAILALRGIQVVNQMSADCGSCEETVCSEHQDAWGDAFSHMNQAIYNVDKAESRAREQNQPVCHCVSTGPSTCQVAGHNTFMH